MMVTPPDLVSPKQVARAIGASESSLKRWCDQGLLNSVRTAGGHRKIPIAEVLCFVRENDYPLVSPELLGLPPISKDSSSGLSQSLPRFIDALLAGDELVARQIIFELYLAKYAPSILFDEVIAKAFREIGDRWACREAEVYQERRGCEIALHILFDLRRIQKLPQGQWRAIGGSPEGDLYSLPTAMAEIVLRDAGFRATSMGTSIPFESLVKAVRNTRPQLFWLSVSHILEEPQFVDEFAKLSDCCSETGTALVVGGRALSEELRIRMSYSAYCDTMQHLAAFAATLSKSLSEGDRKQTPSAN